VESSTLLHLVLSESRSARNPKKCFGQWLIFLQSFFVIESNKPSVTLWQCSGEMHVLCFPHATGAWVIGFEQVLYLGTFDCNVAMFCDHDDICWSTFSRKLSVTWQIQITWNVTDHAAYCGKHSLYINQAKCEI